MTLNDRPLRVRAFAKLNLWLDITGRRADGYHLLRSVMRRAGLYDTVDIALTENDDITIICDDPTVPADERNIAYKACALFRRLYGQRFGARIVIKKNIPAEAGLGGSSTDGAAVLTGLNEILGFPFSNDTLCAASVSLGADIPFCLLGGTAVCRGIGEEMTPIDCGDIAAVIVKPEFSCSTASAYREYDARPCPEKEGFDKFVRSLSADISYAALNMYNVFEVLYNDPRISGIKKELISSGALGACMSGSGSAVFGIFRDFSDAETAAAKLSYKNVFPVRLL